MDVEYPAESVPFAVSDTKQKEKMDTEGDNHRELVAGLTRKVDSSLVLEQPSVSLVNSQQATVETLRRQLEFYFGDPNLYKDEHMRKLIAQHEKGYVELKVLLGFKRISQILNSHHVVKFDERLGLIRHAAESSGILKLCKQKLRVKRLVQFNSSILKQADYAAEVDSRTIYVENIPPYATQETTAQVFKKHGHILLVSMPKDSEGKNQRKNKGFAFVEFEVCQRMTLDQGRSHGCSHCEQQCA